MHCKRPTDTPGKLDYCIKPWMAAAATHERLESCSRKPEPRLAARESSAGGSMGPGECGSSNPLPRRSPRPPGASWTEGPPLLAFERLSTEQSPLCAACAPWTHGTCYDVRGCGSALKPQCTRVLPVAGPLRCLLGLDVQLQRSLDIRG